MASNGNTAAFLCNVAGVTFENPNGESRQEIIKDIIEKEGHNNYWTGPGKLNVIRYVNVEEDRDEPAIEVRIKGKLIGYIPKNKIEEVSCNNRVQSGTVIVQLSYIRQYDVYNAKLFTPNRAKPTKKMEAAVKKILERRPYLELPDYTFDDYRKFLNNNKGGVSEQIKAKVRSI